MVQLLFAAALLAAEDSPAKTSTSAAFPGTPLETRAKVRLSVASNVDDEDDHALSQATGFFFAPGQVLTSRHSLANASRVKLRLSSGKSDGTGILAWNTARYEQAMAYRMAAQADQSDPGLWLLAAERFDELGLLQDAVEAYRKALRAKPDCALAHHNLGLAHLALCQTTQAQQQQRDLIGLDKERADKLFHFILRLGCAAARNRVIPRPAAATRNAP